MPSFGNLEEKILPKPLQAHTKHSKDVVSTSFPMDSESTAVDLDPPHFASLSTDPPLPTVKMNIATSSDLDLPIAHRKGKRSCTQHLISNHVSYDHLTLTISSVCCMLLLFLYLSFIRKRWCIRNESSPWMIKWYALISHQT